MTLRSPAHFHDTCTMFTLISLALCSEVEQGDCKASKSSFAFSGEQAHIVDVDVGWSGCRG
eukprot:560986-Amphidinium_carterae.1